MINWRMLLVTQGLLFVGGAVAAMKRDYNAYRVFLEKDADATFRWRLFWISALIGGLDSLGVGSVGVSGVGAAGAAGSPTALSLLSALGIWT